MDLEETVRVLLVGNGMVGKSSIVSRFAKNTTTERYKKTIGAGKNSTSQNVFDQTYSLCHPLKTLYLHRSHP